MIEQQQNGNMADDMVLPIGAVYPSEVETVFAIVPEGDLYGGAHGYMFTPCLGFNDGKTEYQDFPSGIKPSIRFVEKKDNGVVIPGLQSEQLVLALIDRHKKLNARFPSAQNEAMISCLQRFLELCKERVDDRIRRGVMGDLRK